MEEVVVLCGPSGVGKSTLIDALMEELGHICQFSVSHTTRNPRGQEKEGVHYHFVDEQEFNKLEFYEKVQFTGNQYGTTKNAIRTIIENKKLPILDVNIWAIAQLREHDTLRMTKVFIKPPSLKCLWERLRKRAKSTGESIASSKRRHAKAIEELQILEKENFEHILVNEDLDQTSRKLKEIVRGVIERFGATLPLNNGSQRVVSVNGSVKKIQKSNKMIAREDSKRKNVEDSKIINGDSGMEKGLKGSINVELQNSEDSDVGPQKFSKSQDETVGSIGQEEVVKLSKSLAKLSTQVEN